MTNVCMKHIYEVIDDLSMSNIGHITFKGLQLINVTHMINHLTLDNIERSKVIDFSADRIS